MLNNIVAGIDTGVNTGISFWDCLEERLLHVTSMKIHRAMELILSINPAFVRVEDARIFKGGSFISDAKRHGAGSVKRDASIWEDFLKDKGILYEMISPLDKGKKLDADQFKRQTGWLKTTNEHARDSAMLIFGMTERSLHHYFQILKK